jgi:glutamyl-tRNA synthetase
VTVSSSVFSPSTTPDRIVSPTPRLRFAPSPTGHLHIGGARTALFNWAWARRTGGVFLLRIEDTDRERSRPEFEHSILEGLRWLGLEWDEGPDVGGPLGPYRQSEREDRYRAAVETLLQAGQAYPCFCTSERLERLREERSRAGQNPGYDGHCRDLGRDEAQRRRSAGEACTIRFRVPTGRTVVDDQIRGRVEFDNREVEDWVMVRSSGAPTYNFVVVCDDVDMRITHVLRGEEHLPNTPKQVLLYEAFGKTPPAFAHLPLMLGTDRKKLSKRTGDTSLQDYRDKGYPPEAVLNFLCLQGWALDDKTTIFSAADLIANFDPASVSSGGAVFDPEKFLWMAGEYVRADSTERVAERCLPFVVRAGLATEADLRARWDWYLAAVGAEKERIALYADLPPRLAYLFAGDEDLEYAPDALAGARKHEGRVRDLADYLEWLAPRLESFDAASVSIDTRAWIKDRGLKMPALFQPLRCALTGAAGGVDLFEAMRLLGGARVRRRIGRALERL